MPISGTPFLFFENIRPGLCTEKGSEFARNVCFTLLQKGVQQKEFGKKVTKKVAEASEKVTKK